MDNLIEVDGRAVLEGTLQVVDTIVPSKKTLTKVWQTIFISLINFGYFTGGFFCLNYFQRQSYEDTALKNDMLLLEQSQLSKRFPQLTNSSTMKTYLMAAEHLCYITNNPRPVWTFWSAFDFCVSIVTTVGYGVLHPSVWYSKAFCLVYAMCGLPLYIIMLGAAGKYIVAMFEYLNKRSQIVKRVCQHKIVEMLIIYINIAIIMGLFLYGYSFFGWSASRRGTNKTDLSVIELGSFGFNTTAKVISIPPKNWTLFQSVYYSMISLSTIGFGDYYLGDPEDPRQAFMLFVSVSFGFALFSYSFQTYAKASEEQVALLREKTEFLTKTAASKGLKLAEKNLDKSKNMIAKTL